MNLAEVEERVRQAAQSLPGREAQLLMAARRRPGWELDHHPDAGRPAAALLLLYERDGVVRLPVTVRHANLAKHAGQVSLPGGAIEPGESAEQAAVREAYEEIGVEPDSVTVIGKLTPLHIPVSGFTVFPVVAVTSGPPSFTLASGEVEDVLEIGLDELFDPSRFRSELRIRDGLEYPVPFFAHGSHQIWGATAMVIAEFLWVLGFKIESEKWKVESEK